MTNAVRRLVSRARDARNPALEAARAAHASGDFEEARCLGRPLAAAADAPLEAVRGLAELEYLLGDYAASESLLDRVVAASERDVEARADAEVALALVYLQTNRFAAAHGLFAGIEDGIELPVWTLMKSFGDTVPYRVAWSGLPSIELPFLQRTDWELPRVAVEANGSRIEARLDTGGDLLLLSRGAAEAAGVQPVVSTTGVFAGGAQGALSYGRLDSVGLGGVTVADVPVAIAGLDTSVIGTGFLRQFRATLDYPGGRLVLRPRGSAAEEEPGAVEVPFALALTHLLIVRGSLEDAAPLTFIVDSGLQDEEGTGFAAPAETLTAAGIPLPETTEEVRESGAGHVPLRIGRFPVRRLALGPLAQRDVSGMVGVFPDEWRQAAGFPVHGLVSHAFLRRYVWTLDFDSLTMTFASPREY